MNSIICHNVDCKWNKFGEDCNRELVVIDSYGGCSNLDYDREEDLYDDEY